MGLWRRGIATAAALAVAGSIGAAQAAPTEIQFWHAFSPDIPLGKLLQRLVDDFNAGQSDYKVVTTYKGTYDDTMNATVAAYRAGRHPHIVQIESGNTPTLIYSPAVDPVSDLMQDAGYKIDWSDFIQPVLRNYSKGDVLMALPFNTSTPLLWYNKDALQKAGIAEPPATWEDVGEAARKLRAAGYECGVTSAWQTWVHLDNYSSIENIPVATQDNGRKGFDAEFVFNKTKFVDHVARIRGWIEEGIYTYAGRQWTGAHEVFYAEKCPMMLESSAGYSGVAKNTAGKFAFGAAYLPIEAGNPSPINGTIGGAALFALSGKPEEERKGVAAFFNFLATPEAQFTWHRESGYVPVTHAAYELAKAEGYYEKFPHQELAILQLSRGTPTGSSSGKRLGFAVQTTEILNEELENIWSGKKTPQQGLDDAARRGNELLRRFEKTAATN